VTDTVVRDLAGAAPDELIFELLENCAQGKTGEVLRKTHATLEAGADPDDMLEVLIERLRGTLLAKVCGGDSELLEGQIHLKDSMAKLGTLLSEDQMLMLIQLFNTARRQTRDAAQARLPLEMALIRASRAGDLVELGKLVKAMESASVLSGPPGSRPGHAPIREGPRPNSQGRQADSVDARPAAQQTVGRPQKAEGSESSEGGGQAADGGQDDLRSRLISATRSQKGGAFLASALTHARSIRADEGAGELELVFTTDQMFYTDALEKPHNRAALQSALSALFSREFSVAIKRSTEADLPQAKTATPPLRKSAPSAIAPLRAPAAPAAPPAKAHVPASGEMPDEMAIEEEAETEFVIPDELPMKAPVPAETPENIAPVTTSDDDAPPVPVRPKYTPPAVKQNLPAMNDTDRKTIEQNPLIQMILKESDGVVMNVERGIRPAQRNAKDKENKK
jgi:DNA polymerase III gamma/tau subunit